MKIRYLSADNNVEKIVIQHGNNGEKPTEGAVCHLFIEEITIKPSGIINLNDLNSQILTNSPEIIFTIDEGTSEVDRQIERAILWMGLNEKAIIRINLSSLSDNEQMTLEFKATLIKFEAMKPIWDWTPAEKYSRALSYKEMAVKLMKSGEIKDAFWRFSKAVKLIITLEPIEDLELEEQLLTNINALRTSLYNNMAMCQLKYNNFEYTIDLCTKVLKRDANNVKALYRRGCAYGGLKNLELALNDFQNAIHIDPINIAVREKLKLYSELNRDADKRRDELLRKMFVV